MSPPTRGFTNAWDFAATDRRERGRAQVDAPVPLVEPRRSRTGTALSAPATARLRAAVLATMIAALPRWRAMLGADGLDADRRCPARLLRRHAAMERDRLLERAGRLAHPVREPRSRRRTSCRPPARPARADPDADRPGDAGPQRGPARGSSAISRRRWPASMRPARRAVRGLPAQRHAGRRRSPPRRLRRSTRWRDRAPRPDRLHYRRRADNRGHKTGNLWDFLERARRALRSHARARCRQRDVGRGDPAAGPGHGGPPRDRHPAAADRRPAEYQPVPAHLPVRHAPRHARLHGRQRLVAGRLRALLGPQRADPRRTVHGALPAAAAAGPAAARRPGAQPRPGRGGADAPGRLAGARAAGGGRQLRGEPADPLRLRQARPALVPGQLAVSPPGRPAGPALRWAGCSSGSPS